MRKIATTYTRVYINGKPIDLKAGESIEILDTDEAQYQEDDFEVVTEPYPYDGAR